MFFHIVDPRFNQPEKTDQCVLVLGRRLPFHNRKISFLVVGGFPLNKTHTHKKKKKAKTGPPWSPVHPLILPPPPPPPQATPGLALWAGAGPAALAPLPLGKAPEGQTRGFHLLIIFFNGPLLVLKGIYNYWSLLFFPGDLRKWREMVWREPPDVCWTKSGENIPDEPTVGTCLYL